MKKIIAAGIMLGLLVSTALAFTDADLEKYKTGGSRFVTEDRTPVQSTESAEQAAKSDHHRNDQEYWCQMGKAADDRVSRAAADVAHSPGTISPDDVSHVNRNREALAILAAKIGADEAKRELRRAQQSRERLRDDAYHLGIPLGWLRCQFE